MKAEHSMWFFGCWTQIGHHLWSPGGLMFRHEHARLPWSDVDSTLAPGPRNRHGEVESKDQVEGMARLHHRDGWTALAWWDRSIDKRHGSNAALFMHDVATFEVMLECGRRRFPSVFDRFPYEIRLRSADRFGAITVL